MAMVTFTSNHNTKSSQASPFENTKEEDGEIGVFGAERYFNGGIDGGPRPTKKDSNNTKCTDKHEGRINSEPMKPLIHRGGPSSIHSQSSWNSQKPLLHMNPPMVTKPSKSMHAKSFLSCLGACKCYCFDRNSIDIEVGEISFKRPANGEIVQLQADKHKTTTTTVKEDLFTFPLMDSTSGVRPIKVSSQGEADAFPLMDSTSGVRPIKVSSQGEADEIGRKSLEVFGSPVLRIGRRNKPLNIERRLKMLSWDHSVPKVEEIQNSKGINCDDTESDGSSDLFEIESVTGKPNHCYAPSEASIEWSVITASAVDYEEGWRSTTIRSPIKTISTTNEDIGTKKFNKPRSSGLLGCNSSKAVKVTVDAHKTNQKAGLDPRMRRVSDSYVPATRFRSETKLSGAGDLEPTRTPRIHATRSLSLPDSHSPPQASQMLYIQ